MHLGKNWAKLSCCASLIGLSAAYAAAAVPIYAGPAYVGGTGGAGGINSQTMQLLPGMPVAPGGTAIGRGTQYYFAGAGASPTSDNSASFFFNSSGSTLLQSIGTRPSGNPNSDTVYSINGSGLMSGYVSNSAFTINTATRWDASGNVTPLAPLSVSTAAAGNSSAFGLCNRQLRGCWRIVRSVWRRSNEPWKSTRRLGIRIDRCNRTGYL